MPLTEMVNGRRITQMTLLKIKAKEKREVGTRHRHLAYGRMGISIIRSMF